LVERAVYSVAEAAKILGVSDSKVNDMVRLKQMPHIKLGDRTLIPKAALEQFVIQIREKEASSYSVKEAAIVLGVSEPMVRKLVHQNTLTSYRMGSRILIPKVAIEDLLNEASA
jgi:excisionase family DNA binding protein